MPHYLFLVTLPLEGLSLMSERTMSSQLEGSFLRFALGLTAEASLALRSFWVRGRRRMSLIRNVLGPVLYVLLILVPLRGIEPRRYRRVKALPSHLALGA